MRFEEHTVRCNCESIVCTHAGSAAGKGCEKRAPADGNKIMHIGSVCDGCYKAYGKEYQLPTERGRCQSPWHTEYEREDRDHYLYPSPDNASVKVCEDCKATIAFERDRREIAKREREQAARIKYKCDMCTSAFAEARDLRAHVSLRHSTILGTKRFR